MPEQQAFNGGAMDKFVQLVVVTRAAGSP